MTATHSAVLDALRPIVDPDFGKSIVDLGFVKNIEIESAAVSFEIELTTPACPVKAEFEKAARERVLALDGVDRVDVTMTSNTRGRAVGNGAVLRIPREAFEYIADRQPRVRKLLMRFFRARMVGSLLISSDLFSPLSVEDRRKLVTRFRLRELAPEQVLLEPEVEVDGLYLVLAGRVDLFAADDSTVDTLQSGTVFGALSLVEGIPAPFGVRAPGRAWVLRLPRDDYQELVDNYEEVRATLARLAEERQQRNSELVSSAG